MKAKLIMIPVIAVLFSACGTGKRVTGSSVETGVDDRRADEKIILYPEGDPRTVRTEQAWSDRVAVADGQGPVDPRSVRRPRKNRPQIVFTPEQSQYLQIAGINPLPASGVLELDLAAMAAEFCYPYEGNIISPYGTRGNSTHTGIDIKAIPNDTIRAAFPGVVRMAKEYSSYGNIVVIRHYEGFETVYSHGSENLVKVNDVVEPGDPVALAGRTGRATTEHLHFEFRAGDGHIDPARLLDTDNRALRGGKLYVRSLLGSLVTYRDEAEMNRLQAVANTPEAAREPVKPEVNVRTAAVPSAQGEAVYYNVKKGDTLSAIAVKHKTTVAKICQLSNIKSTAILQINQRLRVK